MFLLVLLACFALAHGHGQVPYSARPYQAGYYIRDPHRHQHAEEVRDHAGAVAGRYGYLDARGIGRQVNYVADHGGLRARVHTNEPAVVPNTPVTARVVSDGLLGHGVVSVPTYIDPVLGYDYGVNGYGLEYDGYGLGYDGYGLGYDGYGRGYDEYGLGYDGYGLGYDIDDLGYGYRGALRYSGLLGNYGAVHV